MLHTVLFFERVWKTSLADMAIVNPRPSRYGFSRIPGRQTPSPTRRRARRLHLIRRLNKNPREHLESNIHCCGQQLRFLNSKSVERDETDKKSSGGVWRCAEGGEAVLRVTERAWCMSVLRISASVSLMNGTGSNLRSRKVQRNT